MYKSHTIQCVLWSFVRDTSGDLQFAIVISRIPPEVGFYFAYFLQKRLGTIKILKKNIYMNTGI